MFDSRFVSKQARSTTKNVLAVSKYVPFLSGTDRQNHRGERPLPSTPVILAKPLSRYKHFRPRSNAEVAALCKPSGTLKTL
jgi:hypothetical protein